MKAKELAYWRERYAAYGLEYHPKSGSTMMSTMTGDWNQFAFRFRGDDGREDLQESDGGATWLAGKNVDLEWPINKPFRLRYLYARTVKDTFPHTHRLRRSHEGGSYSNVLGTSTVLRIIASPWLPNPGERPTDFTGRVGTGPWGQADASSIHTNMRDSPSNQFITTPNRDNGDCESEVSLILVPGDIVVGETVDLKQTTNVLMDYISYANTPRITALAEEDPLSTQELLISP